MPELSNAVFLSYASQDADAARRICEALRAAGIEVWFDQSELRGGDAWDQKIRRQIRECAVFLPVISANTAARSEGYFRLEWALADQRSQMIARNRVYIVPVCLDRTTESVADVPESFQRVQWTRAPAGEASATFIRHILQVLVQGSSAEVLSTPDGTIPQSGPDPVARADAKRKASRARRVLLTVALCVVVFGAAYYLVSPGRHPAKEAGAVRTVATAAANRDRSIAVLPFADMSEHKDQEYFADGLSEEILNLLAGVPTLSVIGRTSSFQFKGQNGDLRAIGAKLGAAFVLEGSVRRAGDRVRVTAQLVRTDDGVRRWSNTYDRPFGDVLTLQSELAADVARAMEITVGSDTLRSHAASANPEAYDFYLHGLTALDRYDREGFEAGLNYFQQALDLDQNFAAAETGIGRISVFQAEFGFGPAAEAYERARRSLKNAIRLDPTSGAAHAWLGWVFMAYDWNWKASAAEMTRALELSPRDPVVLLCASRLSYALGRWDENIKRLSAALAHDPLYAAASNNLAEVYARVGRLTEAESAERRVLEMRPTYSSAAHNLAVILVALARPGDALKVLTVGPQTKFEQSHALIVVYYALGRKADSNAQLSAFTRDHANDDAYDIASAHAYRGERDEAFRWLERAYRQKDPGLYLIKGDLLFLKYESDLRFRAFLSKMNLPN